MTMRRLLLLATLAGCARAPLAPPATVAPRPADSAAFESYVSGYLAGGRGRAGAAGDSLPAFLAGLSAEAPRRAAQRAAEQLVALRRIDTMGLASAQRVDWLLIESQLKRTVYDTILRTPARVPGRYLTLGDLYWRVAGVGDLPPSERDWLDVRQSLERAPQALALGRRQLRAPPPLWTRLALGTARSYAGFLRGEYRERLALAPDSLRGGLALAGEQAAAALDGFAAFLQDTLAPGPDDSWAAGRAYYDWVLRDVNFLPPPMDAAGMIAAGRQIHEATKLALDSLAARLRPGTPWRTLVSEIQGRHPEPGRIADAYRRHSDRVHALLQREALITIPARESLIFVPTPPQLRETYAWGGYGGITVRDSVQVGRFFVTDVVPSMTAEQVAEKLRAQNDGWIPVIALHEGYPGHHLQQVYARTNARRVRRAGGNTYYGEGWALYAEHWMARAGLFDTPDAQLGQLQMRLWRTARVIIDPSLHTGEMSYEQAVQFLVDEVGLERSAAEAEVNRFTTWPTQAPSYIIGWLEIERLERDVRAALGSRFDHRQFVERVLEAGPLPPLLMRRVVLQSYGLAS